MDTKKARDPIGSLCEMLALPVTGVADGISAACVFSIQSAAVAAVVVVAAAAVAVAAVEENDEDDDDPAAVIIIVVIAEHDKNPSSALIFWVEPEPAYFVRTLTSGGTFYLRKAEAPLSSRLAHTMLFGRMWLQFFQKTC